MTHIKLFNKIIKKNQLILRIYNLPTALNLYIKQHLQKCFNRYVLIYVKYILLTLYCLKHLGSYL